VTATIAIIDDDEAVRDSLGARLSAEGYSVEEFASADPFLDLETYLKLDCCLVDVRMPGMSGIQLVEHLKARDPFLPAIMISGHGDIETAVRAVKAGASGFLEKPINTDKLHRELETALTARAKGRETAKALLDCRANFETLTPRERDVFRELTEGHPNKIIAHNLGCSQRTVEIHRARVMDKMDAKNVADLVHTAHMLGVS